MMKSKLFLKNSVKSALLLLVSLTFLFFLSACSGRFEPTYKEKDIPDIVKRICKNEYGLDVTTIRTNTTLWIYAPLDKILHKEYGIKENKIFDDEMAKKLRNILTTIGRVLLSADKTPDFFTLVTSDIQQGYDYVMIGYVLDIKKSSIEFIPWAEANRRYVIGFNKVPEAVGDTTGSHIKPFDITLSAFLAQQIAQRIAKEFTRDDLKSYFKVDKSDGLFYDGEFIFEFNIQQIAKPKKKIDVLDEAAKIAGYCLKTYSFNDFQNVVFKNLADQSSAAFNKKALLSKPIF